MYAKDISKKIKSVKRDKQRKGLFIGGKAPFGYLLSKTEKNRLEIDTEAAPLVHRIFNMALAGQSCRQIATTLNEEKTSPPSVYAGLTLGRVGPYSHLWSSERVTEMLRNEMYIGNMVQGRTQKISYKTKQCRKIPREDWVVVENTHEPLVSKELFEQVQRLIDSRNHTRSRKYEYLLKGFIFCHECGYPLGVINRKNAAGDDVLYFVCRTYQRFTSTGVCTPHCIKEEKVTKAVMEQVRLVCRRFRGRDLLAQGGWDILKSAEAAFKTQHELEAITTKQQQLANNIDQVYMDKLAGRLREQDFQRIYGQLCEQQVTIQQRRMALETELKQPQEDYHQQALEHWQYGF